MNTIVFITGSTSGIGEACAYKFAAEGARLILNGRDTGKLKALQQSLQMQYGTESLLLPFDVRDRQAAGKAITGLNAGWQAVDILINNAGLVLGVDKEFEGNPDEWDIVIDTNIKGLLTITRLVVPLMLKQQRGHIINIGSIAGDAAYAGGSVYCATKAAVKALSDGLRIDLVDTPLRVTNIKPGMVKTHFSITRYRGDKTKADAVYRGLKPLTGADIAETIYFVASVPEHIQIAEVLVMPTQQATGTIVHHAL
ncbi:MAG: SDR family NAD(P)-dependent oxidoreductase [Dysgonamonadaceae bacterium]|jgi:NADP-dependent 3-hydroxy acid dehydrogenase YdfG|nr:SDR family NAD(P)-dependent oxidoreductase [Dysgonamonadaceae bacterium]